MVSLDEIRNPNKVWRHLPKQIELASNGDIPPPISIEIQPTSACNLRCKWCSYWERNDFDSNKSQYIDPKIINKLLEFSAISGVKSIYLAGGGEPCAYPYIREIVNKIHNLNLSIGIITNGTLFAKKLLDMADYFTYLQVSLISSDSNEYSQVTGRSKGFTDMQALPKIIKNAHQNQPPLIGGMYVLTQWNYKNAFNVINFCQENGFDYCSFRIALDYENRGVSLPEKCYEFLKEGIAKQRINDSYYTNLEKVLSSTETSSYKPSSCINIKLGLYAIVDTNGGVYSCVPDIGKKEFCIGSLQEKSFGEIWNSDTHHNVVKNLNIRYCNQGCHIACRAHSYNKVAQGNIPKNIPAAHSDFL